MEKEQKVNVTRVSQEVSGRPDGVESAANCVVSRFVLNGAMDPTGLKVFPERYRCKLMAAHSNGTMSVSIRELGAMVTLRIADVADLLKAADNASSEEPLS